MSVADHKRAEEALAIRDAAHISAIEFRDCVLLELRNVDLDRAKVDQIGAAFDQLIAVLDVENALASL